ncbi:hypothetical protein [Pseudolysinimonas sp.]|uniref:hypothetical protein n=1 Tax=Pseudolysinimonas sp. TaxID=2680009 RepID=UPI003F7E3FDB
MCARPRSDAWTLDLPRDEPERRGLEEVLLGLGNGYVFVRSAPPEAPGGDGRYAGVYVAGVYNRLATPGPGGVRVDESVVNLPDWARVAVRSPRGDLFDPGGARTVHDHRRLDLRRGVLHRVVLVREAAGERTAVEQERFVSMSDPHLAYLRVRVRPLDWSGTVAVTTAVDADVANDNVPAFAGLANRHLRILQDDADARGIRVLGETTQSRIVVATFSRSSVDPAPTRELVGPGPRRTVEIHVAPDRPAAIMTSLSRI